MIASFGFSLLAALQHSSRLGLSNLQILFSAFWADAKLFCKEYHVTWLWQQNQQMTSTVIMDDRESIGYTQSAGLKIFQLKKSTYPSICTVMYDLFRMIFHISSESWCQSGLLCKRW